MFVPLIFVEGVSGIMMQQLGGLIAATLIASVLCSLLLTPMLASRILRARGEVKEDSRYGRFMAWSDKKFDNLDIGYSKLLNKALSIRWVVTAVSALVIGLTIYLFTIVGSEFMGTEDTGELNISFHLPLSTRYEITTQTGYRMIDKIKEIVGEENLKLINLSTGGTSGGFGGNRASHIGSIRLKLVDAKYRTKTAEQYGDMITREVSTWPEITKVYANSNNFLNRILRGGGANLTVDVYGYDLDKTSAVATQIKEIAGTVRGARDIRVSQDMGKPELTIKVDREKAGAIGISMNELTTVISTLFQGDDCSQYREGEDEYDINLRLERANRNTIEDIRRSELPLSNGKRIRLDSIADVVEDTGPVTISRKNQQRIITVELDTIDRPQGDVMAELEQRIKAEVMLPNGVNVEYGGMIEEQEDSEKAMIMMITLGVILVFMVMAAQFESLLHPLLIMFSVPFAFSGVVCALLLTGTPLSMTAYIGMILLVGIVVNNAIVLVDYINILRARGVPLRQAITDSGRQRLRPVLITTCTTLLGMLPMALSTGDGSATWRPLGIVVVGGLLLSTIVSMIIVPTLYYIVEGWRERRAAKKEA